MAEPVALQVQQPNAMQNIGSMLNIANTAQNIQSGGVKLQDQQMDMEERKALRSIAQNIKSYTKEDGSPDYDKLIPEAISKAPKLGMQFVEQTAAAHAKSVAANQAFNSLAEEQRAAVNKVVMSVADQPFDVQQGALRSIEQGNPRLKPWVDIALGSLQKHAEDPEALKKRAYQIATSHGGIGEQTTAQTGTFMGTGAEFKQVSPVAAALGNSKPVPATVPPQAQETTELDALGNKYVVTRSPSGAIVNTRPMPNTGGGGSGANFVLQPGDREAIPVLQKERDEARNILLGAPVAHATNRGVLQEIDHVSATGVTGPAFQKMNSLLGGGLDFSTPEKKASSYDLVGKYLERNALNAAASMGPQTNAYLEAQIKANGSLGYNPTAIKKITKLNDAIVSGSELYQPGLEKAIAADPNKGVLAKRQFDQDWAKNFEPMVMQLHNAQKDGDKAEIADIVKSIGGANSDKAKDILRRAKNIEKLSTEGRL